MTDILDHERLATRLRALAAGYKKRFGDLLVYDVEDEISRLKVGLRSDQSLKFLLYACINHNGLSCILKTVPHENTSFAADIGGSLYL